MRVSEELHTYMLVCMPYVSKKTNEPPFGESWLRAVGKTANRGKVDGVFARRTSTVNTLLANAASNLRCRACGRHGHWEAACKSKSTNDGPKPSSRMPRRPYSQCRSGRRGNKQIVHQLRVNEDSNDNDTFQDLEFNSVAENNGRDKILAILDI